MKEHKVTDEIFTHADIYVVQALSRVVAEYNKKQKEDSETKNEDEIKFPDFIYYNLQSEKGKEIQDMVMILRSLKATEDLIFKVVQLNCGIELTARQRASL